MHDFDEFGVALPLASRHTLYRDQIHSAPLLQVEGQVTRMVGLGLEAIGFHAAVGSRCLITSESGGVIAAEVVGFDGDRTFLMPLNDVQQLAPGAKIIATGQRAQVSVSPDLRGRIVDGNGRILDNLGPISYIARVPLYGQRYNPLIKASVQEPFDVGVRAINACLTVAKGQCLGLFSDSGVGKSVLLGMITRFCEADVVVIGMIGERSREIKEFIADILGEEGLRKSIIIVSTVDDPPLTRLHAALRATSIAEYFRDQGRQVLLLLDSLTRFAQAQREISLSIGESSAANGYPVSMFTRLAQLVERAGNGMNEQGGITAIYTVLTENDNPSDPVVAAARAILDGQIVLSRELSEAGHYPAIDIASSNSRAMAACVTQTQLNHVRQLKKLYINYQSNRNLFATGTYNFSSDLELDQAIRLYPAIVAFLQQAQDQAINFHHSLAALEALLTEQKVV